jgi:small subunit ribosomal protein S2
VSTAPTATATAAATVAVKELLEAGVHFGHQTRRWNPKMKEYIFGERNGIYIVDLQKTLVRFQEALTFVENLAARGGTVMFIATKRQAQETVAEEARRCGMPYVTERWLGGLLTNFVTIRKSLDRLKELDAKLDAAANQTERITKKELARYTKERTKIDKHLVGIKLMKNLPDAVFVVDTRNEAIAVAEARKLKIPVIGVVDTNCDPDLVDFVIPGNDDALRAIKLFTGRVADAILAGRGIRESHDSDAAASKAAPVAAAPAPQAPAPVAPAADSTPSA